MHIVKVSPKGQITIPVELREQCKSLHYALEMKGPTIILRPMEMKVLGEIPDELKDFSALANQSFDFWDNDEDDIYSQFYEKR